MQEKFSETGVCATDVFMMSPMSYVPLRGKSTYCDKYYEDFDMYERPTEPYPKMDFFSMQKRWELACRLANQTTC